MINKNCIYGKVTGVTVAEFGTGDIEMNGSEKDKNGSVHLAFKTVETPGIIGKKVKSTYKTFDEMQPEIVFIFNKIESIDSVINMLKDCRKDFKKKINL